jgi:hypothetical protein
MKRTDPPALAVWMLEHLTFAAGTQALAGDLLEEFRAGRSQGWYWRQVLMAIGIGVSRQIVSHWPAMLFAALWTLLAPALHFYTVRKLAESAFIARRWSLPWPYSTICDIGLDLGCALFYIWAGLVLYLLLSKREQRSLNLRALPRALRISLPVFVVATGALAAWAAIVSGPPPIDVRHISPGQLILITHWQAALFRAHYFLTFLIPAWIVFPNEEEAVSIEGPPLR